MDVKSKNKKHIGVETAKTRTPKQESPMLHIYLFNSFIGMIMKNHEASNKIDEESSAQTHSKWLS